MSTTSVNQDTTLFGQTIGYVRVSTAEQNPNRQHEAIGPCDKVFEDRMSGKSKTNRKQLNALIDYARQGDTIRVEAMERLGRDTRDLYSILDTLTDKGCTVTFVTEGITISKDKNSPTQELFLSFLAAMAQFERSRILERQREGIALAKAQGVYQRKLTTDDVEACRTLVDMGIPVSEAARRYNASRQTLYTALKGQGAYTPPTA